VKTLEISWGMLCRMREAGEHLAHRRRALGAGGPRFKSGRPDFKPSVVRTYCVGPWVALEPPLSRNSAFLLSPATFTVWADVQGTGEDANSIFLWSTSVPMLASATSAVVLVFSALPLCPFAA